MHSSYQERSTQIAKERRLRPIIRRVTKIVLLVFATLTISLVAWLIYSGSFADFKEKMFEKALRTSSEFGLNLENIYFDGLNHLKTENVLSLLPKESHRKIPILGISVADLKRDIEEFGWVKEANIERQLPNTLHIKIIERTPYAIWQNKGQLALIDRDGYIITRDGVEKFGGLSIVIGEDANLHVSSLFEFVEEEGELIEDIASIIRVGGRRWDIRLKNDIEIKLPEKEPEKSWRYIANLHREKHLLDRSLKTIDLRVSDRMFIKPKK